MFLLHIMEMIKLRLSLCGFLYHIFIINRLYRGSGYAGLACMRPIQIMEDGTRRIRPFLKISKQRLLATCSSLSIPYVLDPSNTDLQFDRNRVRYGILQIRDKKLMNIQSILQVIDYFQLVR